jgi:hypothetical protein
VRTASGPCGEGIVSPRKEGTPRAAAIVNSSGCDAGSGSTSSSAAACGDAAAAAVRRRWSGCCSRWSRTAPAIRGEAGCDPLGGAGRARTWLGLPSVNEDAAYRAMDLLLQHLLRARHRRHPGRPRRTRSSATTAATTKVIAATSTTTLRPPLARAGGFRTYRHSKASREDLPRIVIGWPSPAAGSTTGARQSRAIAAVRGMCGCSRSPCRKLSTHPLASADREKKVVGPFTLGLSPAFRVIRLVWRSWAGEAAGQGGEVVPELVEFEVAVPHLSPAVR